MWQQKIKLKLQLHQHQVTWKIPFLHQVLHHQLPIHLVILFQRALTSLQIVAEKENLILPSLNTPFRII